MRRSRRSRRGLLLTAIPTFHFPRFIGPRRQTSCHSSKVSSFTQEPPLLGISSLACATAASVSGSVDGQQSHCSTLKPSPSRVWMCLSLKDPSSYYESDLCAAANMFMFMFTRSSMHRWDLMSGRLVACFRRISYIHGKTRVHAR